MKRLRVYFIYIMIIIFFATSCNDKNAKLDETNKFLNEDYSQNIIPIEDVNDILLDEYDNEVLFTQSELDAIEKYKGQVIRVAIPTMDGFYDNIDGVDVGINYFAGLQLEKDLGLEFEYHFLDYSEVIEKINNNEIDIVVGKNSTEIYYLYGINLPTTTNYLSKNYFSTPYSIYSKTNIESDIYNLNVLVESCGILLPQRESDAINAQNVKIKRYPNIKQAATTQELLDLDLQYLVLPEDSMALSAGYIKHNLEDNEYNISSRYVFRHGFFNSDFVSAVNKTINTTKESSLSNYKKKIGLIKCVKGYFFTQEEQDYINSNPTIRTKYLPSLYPISFYDESTGNYNGKLVVILNRISQVVGLNFENVTNNTEISRSELIANLYNNRIDLAVGLENSFDKSMFIKYSNSVTTDSNIIIGYRDIIKESNDIYKYRVGFVSNASVDDYLTNKYPSKDFDEFFTIYKAYEALENGEIDCIATSKNNYYYLLNKNKDYSLKNLYDLDYMSDSRYAAPRDNEGQILISIINKVSDYIESEEITNANYPLSEIDTVGSYRSNLFFKLFIVFILLLLILSIYFYNQQKKTERTANSIKILNRRLDASFKIANFAILTNKIGSDYFIINDTAKQLLGILDEDVSEKNGESIILFTTIIDRYLEDESSINTFNTVMQLIYSIKDTNFKEHTIKLAFKYKADVEQVRYFDVVVNLDEFNLDHALLLFKDTTKETLYERYENVVSDTDIVTKAKNRDVAYKLDLSNYNDYTFGYIDIDDFNIINTTFGHRKGDVVLGDLVSCLVKLKQVYGVYRMNGDEFLVILSDFNKNIADEIQEIFTRSVSFNGYDVKLSASIGYYTARISVNNSIEEVINIAEYTKTQSKENGRNLYTIANEKILSEFKQNNMIDASLKRAIYEGEIIPYFQPYIDINTNKVVGYETLMRWKTEKGVLSPFAFLSIAIKSGDIFDLDLLMFKHSAMLLKTLQDEGLADENFVASSNFTPLTLVKVNPFDLVRIAMEVGVETSNITIEVTEQLFASDKAFEHIKLLKQYGFNIALDDFSVGHSSMAYLKRLSVDVLKIDKSLLDDTNNKTNLEIFKTVVSLGKSLNAKIISEGVETAEEVDVLIDSKVNIGQGYYFLKPADLDSIYEFISVKNKD